MGRTACTEPQCLYKGALLLTIWKYKGALLLTIWKYKGALLLTIWKYKVTLLLTIWKYRGTLLLTIWKYKGALLLTIWKYKGALLLTIWKYKGALLLTIWKYKGALLLTICKTISFSNRTLLRTVYQLKVHGVCPIDLLPKACWLKTEIKEKKVTSYEKYFFGGKLLYNMSKFSSYLTENKMLLDYKDRTVNAPLLHLISY